MCSSANQLASGVVYRDFVPVQSIDSHTTGCLHSETDNCGNRGCVWEPSREPPSVKDEQRLLIMAVNRFKIVLVKLSSSFQTRFAKDYSAYFNAGNSLELSTHFSFKSTFELIRKVIIMEIQQTYHNTFWLSTAVSFTFLRIKTIEFLRVRNCVKFLSFIARLLSSSLINLSVFREMR